jgi:hypothetical protein
VGEAVSVTAYELRARAAAYQGPAVGSTLEIFRAFGRDKQYSIELLTITRQGSVGQSEYVIEKHDGATVIPLANGDLDNDTTFRFPGPFHFIGTDNGDQYMTVRPTGAGTHTFLSSYISYSEE